MAKKKTKKRAAMRTSSKPMRKKASTTSRKKTARKATARRRESLNENDIIQMIVRDHEEIRPLLETMVDLEGDFEERRRACEEFAPLLVAHSKAEEKVLYPFMKQDEDLRAEGFEGEVEHSLADQMLEEAKRTDNKDLWSARVKVLAEVVESHIEQEETNLLPDFKRSTNEEMRIEMGERFMEHKRAIQEMGGEDSPSERDLEIRANH